MSISASNSSRDGTEMSCWFPRDVFGVRKDFSASPKFWRRLSDIVLLLADDALKKTCKPLKKKYLRNIIRNTQMRYLKE